MPAAPKLAPVTDADTGSTQCQASWTPGAANGATIKGWTLSATPRGGGAATTRELPAGSTSANLTGLTNGATYVLKVVGTTTDGAASPDSNTVTCAPYGVPSVPTAVVPDGADKTVTVTWQAPADDGGSPVTTYRVKVNDVVKEVPGSQLSASVGGLTNGTSYAVIVQAVNRRGGGEASAPKNATPAGTPTVTFVAKAPARGTVRAAQITVNWNGHPVGECTLVIDGVGVQNGTCDSIDRAGLADDTKYTMRVKARSQRDVGVSADDSVRTDPAPAPPPRSVSVSKGADYYQAGHCERTCKHVLVHLENFPAGNHHVTCHDSDGQYNSYDTDKVDSGASGQFCAYGMGGRTHWVVVDGVDSPHVPW